MKYFLLITLIFALVACSPSESAIQTAIVQTQIVWTSIPTQTYYPTYTPNATCNYAPTIFVSKKVTSTFTTTPLYTPIETIPPTATNSPSSTMNPLVSDKPDGVYLIGTEIEPGVWQAIGPGIYCGWIVTTRTSNIITINNGSVGMTAYIPSNGFQVEFLRCGFWTYLGP